MGKLEESALMLHTFMGLTCLRSSPSSVAERQAWTQLSTERSTSLPASINCSWQTGELMVGLTTYNRRGGGREIYLHRDKGKTQQQINYA